MAGRQMLAKPMEKPTGIRPMEHTPVVITPAKPDPVKLQFWYGDWNTKVWTKYNPVANEKLNQVFQMKLTICDLGHWTVNFHYDTPTRPTMVQIRKTDPNKYRPVKGWPVGCDPNFGLEGSDVVVYPMVV